MSTGSKIEWTDHTFNPWEGCQKVGPGCDNCYAEARNARFGGGTAPNWGAGAPRRRTSTHNWDLPLRWNREAVETGIRPRVFCASLADVFDKDAPQSWRTDLWDLIEATPGLDWLLLTKRIGNAASMLPKPWIQQPRSNVWLGATIVNQTEADRDIPKLLAVPARVRFLSMEPLLGPVDLGAWIGDESCHVCSSRFYGDEMNLKPGGVKTVDFEDQPEDEENIRRVCPNCGTVDIVGEVGEVDEEESGGGLHWVIVGGESGPGARPMHPDWASSLRDQCQVAGVPFFFKQWGEWAPLPPTAGFDEGAALHAGTVRYLPGDGRAPDGHFRRGDAAVRRVGKKAAGRLLDGRTWDEVPA